MPQQPLDQALILGVDDFYRLSKPTLLISGAKLFMTSIVLTWIWRRELVSCNRTAHLFSESPSALNSMALFVHVCTISGLQVTVTFVADPQEALF